MTYVNSAIRFAIPLLLVPLACGGGDDSTTATDSGGVPDSRGLPDSSLVDAIDDHSLVGDVVAADSPTDDSGISCTALLDSSKTCTGTRCWPAYRVLCTKGNAKAVEGMYGCLVGNTMCWDVGDPNTAIPCMKTVVAANATSELTAVSTKLMSIGCTGNSLVEDEAFVTMMATADQAAYGTCIASATSCSDPLIRSCLSSTALDPSLCK